MPLATLFWCFVGGGCCCCCEFWDDGCAVRTSAVVAICGCCTEFAESGFAFDLMTPDRFLGGSDFNFGAGISMASFDFFALDNR